MTPETLQLLHRCLANVTLRVGDPDYAELASATVRALAELDEAIAEAEKKG